MARTNNGTDSGGVDRTAKLRHFESGQRAHDRKSDDNSQMLVLGAHGKTAEECYVEAIGQTVAEANPAYPASDPVTDVAFVEAIEDTLGIDWEADDVLQLSMDGELGRASIKTYAYPESRLAPVEEGTNVFVDAPLDARAILGTRTFENVLYSRENATDHVPVDVRTGKPTVGVSTEEIAKDFAEESTREDGHQRVAVPQSTEAMVETRNAPYVSTVFYGGKVVRGKLVGRDDLGQPEYANDGHALEWTYRAAVQSDAYEVQLVAADYQTGDVTIRVVTTGDC